MRRSSAQSTFQGTDEAHFVQLTIFKTPQAQRVPLDVEAHSEQVAGLGDAAFWASGPGLFVHKGGRIMGLFDPSMSTGRDALVELARKALPKL